MPRSTIGFLTPSLLALALSGVASSARAAHEPEIVTVCVTPATGAARFLLTISPSQACAAGEVAIPYDAKCHAGPPGPRGDKGDKGAPGQQGPSGPPGPVLPGSEVLAFFSLSGNEIFLTGANLNVVNGLGATATPNGLGNVVIGYNEGRGAGDDRSGSHMLVVGSENNYSRAGGVVVGFHNEASGDFASVTGGNFNTASGLYSAVGGGFDNTASGLFSSVSGGFENTASGGSSSVSGGLGNLSSGAFGSVSGGAGNTAGGIESSVSGGSSNAASGDDSSVSGGLSNTASGNASSVSGGTAVSSAAENGWAAGAPVAL